MSEHAIQCFVCSVDFETPEKLRDHTWYYQTEITALLARLHELLAHRGLGPKDSDPSSDYDDQEWRENTVPNIPDQVSGRPDGADGDISFTQEPEPTERAATSQQPATFECTHQDCGGKKKKKTFTRYQDLVRHYAIHLNCNEFCPYCSTTFTKANKYINHKCTSEGPQNQQEYTKTRVEALKKNAKRELKGKRAVQAAHSGSDRAKRRKIAHSAAHGSMLQHAPPTPTVKLGTAARSTNDTLQSQDTATREPASSNMPASVSSDDKAQSPFSSHVLHPLYWPFDSGGYDQMPEFPTPLWSTQPGLLPSGGEVILRPVEGPRSTHYLDGEMGIQDAVTSYQTYL